jgi:hypothetical protein
MASIINLNLFVDDDTDLEGFSLGQIIDLVQTLRASGRIIDGECSSEQTITELDDSVANDTYQKGEAFLDRWVGFSPVVASYTSPKIAYWSQRSQGYENVNLATRIRPLKSEADHLRRNSFNGDLVFVIPDHERT